MCMGQSLEYVENPSGQSGNPCLAIIEQQSFPGRPAQHVAFPSPATYPSSATSVWASRILASVATG